MKSIEDLQFEDISKIKILSFDSDGVSVIEGTKIIETDKELRIRTQILSGSMLEKLKLLKKRFYLNFTSGRSLLHLAKIYESILSERVSLQGENGIFTLKDGQVIQHGVMSWEEQETIGAIKKALKKLSFKNQDVLGFEPKQFLISLHCRKPVSGVEEIVKKVDTKGNFYIYWNGEAYDIAPKRFNKGDSLRWLIDILGFQEDEVLVVGNDPNDKPMFESVKLNITTDPEVIRARFATTGKTNPAGEEVADKLLSLV